MAHTAAEDHREGATPVVIVSDAFWRTHLNGERDLASLRLTVASFRRHVIGVMPPGFGYPADVDLWYPMELDPANDSRTSHSYGVIGRLANDVTIAQADAERPMDPLAVIAALAVLGMVAWTASLLPSVRSVRMHPLEAMREGSN